MNHVTADFETAPLQALLLEVPGDWLASARAMHQPVADGTAPLADEVVTVLLPRLGWP